jgi:hypothetical protein
LNKERGNHGGHEGHEERMKHGGIDEQGFQAKKGKTVRSHAFGLFGLSPVF